MLWVYSHGGSNRLALKIMNKRNYMTKKDFYILCMNILSIGILLFLCNKSEWHQCLLLIICALPVYGTTIFMGTYHCIVKARTNKYSRSIVHNALLIGYVTQVIITLSVSSFFLLLMVV